VAGSGRADRVEHVGRVGAAARLADAGQPVAEAAGVLADRFAAQARLGGLAEFVPPGCRRRPGG
jgi:hypothetical protein